MLSSVETETRRTGLFTNGKKTEVILINHDDPTPVRTLNGSSLKKIDNLK